jgi:hypothetical protein
MRRCNLNSRLTLPRKLPVVLFIVFLLSIFPLSVYANGISSKDIATQKDFHLHSLLQLTNDQPLEECWYPGPDPDGPPSGQDNPQIASTSITGNLFTFTHPGTPDSGCIIEWDYTNAATADKPGTISGSFVIDKSGEFLAGYGSLNGTISISFNARSQYVPPINEDEPDHYNFSGSFKITDGTNFYEGIRGTGTISGTFHDHAWGYGWGNQQTWFDFVLIGKAK